MLPRQSYQPRLDCQQTLTGVLKFLLLPWTKPSRFDEIVASIETGDIDRLFLDEPPVDEELGRWFSQAFASNPHITEIWFYPTGCRLTRFRDVISWFSIGGETLVHFTNLQRIIVHGYKRNTFMPFNQDLYLIFPLLLTSTLLQELEVTNFSNRDNDRFVRDLVRYLGAASIRNLELYCGDILSEASFTSFCDGVARSSLQKLTLGRNIVGEENFETAAESLARAILESSLEEVTMRSALLCSALCSALLRTAPIRDFDIAFSQTGDETKRLKINRKWKPLLVANIPLGLWPHIFEKSHTSPKTSHSPEDILFFFLRQKPDLLNSTSSKLGVRRR
jgi:hypothetical protein